MRSAPAAPRLDRVLAAALRACTAAGALALFAMMFATDADIVSRLAANSPVRGVVEMVEIAVLASAMLALPETFLRDQQIRIDLIDGFLSARALVAVRIASMLACVAFLGVMCWNIWAPLRDARMFGDVKPDLGTPVWPLYALILAAFLASILGCALAVRALLRGEDPGREAGA